MARELLLEVGLEEVPCHYLPNTLDQMRDLASRMLQDHRLPYKKMTALATPRRLFLSVDGLAEKQTAASHEIQGPPKHSAYDAQGQPNRTALGFAQAYGVSPSDLKIKKTERGEYVCVVVQEKRRATADLLKELLPQFLAQLTFPKMMRWGSHKGRFVRPIHWILALYSGRVIPFTYNDLKSGNRSYGHSLMSSGSFTVRDLKSYFKEIQKRFVVVDQTQRKAIIEEQIASLTRAKKGRIEEDEELLDRNIFLTEYPVALCGRFEEHFLDLPVEVLVNVMREQQGYFAVYASNGRILPYFICIADVKAKKMGDILVGHERVLKARLEDARFYFQEDQRIPLERRVDGLQGVVFHDQLGTLYEKMQRLIALGSFLAERLEPSSLMSLQRAARLCKADLLTGMVREFPMLQGVMGREYARLQGEGEDVCRAIFEHYLPRFANDPAMPKTPVSKFLAIADKLDTISGCFGIGLEPTGSEDPYGLRRQGQGLVRILVDGIFLKLSLRELVGTSLALYKEKVKKDPDRIAGEVITFLRERMQSFLKARATTGKNKEIGAAWFSQGTYRSDLVDAVLLHQFDNVAEAYRRIVALVIFHQRPEFDPLMVVYKRAARIVPEGFSVQVRHELFKERVEHELLEAYRRVAPQVDTLMKNHQHEDMLALLAGLRKPIDDFFIKVFVMDEDLAVRNNRLALLKGVCDLFNKFADFSQIVVEGKG
jgi:glycyl-tRNA synthetase beta chain